MAESKKPAFVFVHGAWSNVETWTLVLPLLRARGYEARALDLPGAGGKAKMPASYGRRPLDRAAFAREPSPNAGVTQEERTRAVVDAIAQMRRPVVLVGHSMGGATAGDVAEEIPDALAAVVFLAAFLLAPGVTALEMIQHPTMASDLPSLLMADPAQVGALRLDHLSDDPVYRATLKGAIAADVEEALLARVAPTMHCDEPASVVLRPSRVTADRFGRVPRHYIRCTQDRAVPLTGQDFMIAGIDAALGGETIPHTLDTSHSPFFSRPMDLVDILVGIAG
jgi:pimeloyl-ACP methyl ester carboxylesterase